MAQNINGAVNTPESILTSELINEFEDLSEYSSEEALRRLCNSVVYFFGKSGLPHSRLRHYCQEILCFTEDAIYTAYSETGKKSK